MNFIKKLLSPRPAKDGDFFMQIKSLINTTPGNLKLYEEAFRHSSASLVDDSGLSTNNERLEFLGDAILGTVVADFLFAYYPQKKEGFLSSMRAKIVSRSNINDMAKALGLKSLLISNIRPGQEGKAALGNALEALIGAIYLDKGYLASEKFVSKKLIEDLLDIAKLEETVISYKSLLLEWGQKHEKKVVFSRLSKPGTKQYKTSLQVDGFDEIIKSASSKRSAEESSAELIYKKITSNS